MNNVDSPIEQLVLWPLTQSQEERELLHSGTELIQVRAGQTVFVEGDAMLDLYFLHSGKVILSRDGVSGRSHISRLIRPGEFFGIRCYFRKTNSQTTATVSEDATVLRLSGETMRQLLDSNSRICQYFIEVLANELGVVEERMITLTQKHIRGRLAETLLQLARHYGYECDGATINISLSRSDLATLSNMTTSNAIRTLSDFATERLVALDGRRIRIIDQQALEKVGKHG